MIFAGILAGGSGSRMETATMPKQFIRVCDVPIFIRTLRTFLAVPQIDKVIVSTNPDWEYKYNELMDEFNIDKDRVVLVKGGETRFLSLVNVSKKAYELDPSNDSIIITHDCARMFVSKRIIEDNLNDIKDYDMVTTSIPVIDTILQSDDGKSSRAACRREGTVGESSCSPTDENHSRAARDERCRPSALRNKAF